MEPRLQALFIACNNLKEIELFYGDLLELKCSGGASGNFDVWIGMYLTFYEVKEASPLYHGWAQVSGTSIGGVPAIAWSIQLPEEHFKKVLAKLQNSKIPKAQSIPEWRNYRMGFTVKDPMGYTVEICTIPPA